MAKDTPNSEGAPNKPDEAASADRQDAETRPSADDAGLEGERESLKKARETDAQGFDGDAAADGYGNLHFGDQNYDEPEHDGAAARDGESVASNILSFDAAVRAARGEAESAHGGNAPESPVNKGQTIAKETLTGDDRPLPDSSAQNTPHSVAGAGAVQSAAGLKPPSGVQK